MSRGKRGSLQSEPHGRWPSLRSSQRDTRGADQPISGGGDRTGSPTIVGYSTNVRSSVPAGRWCSRR